MKHKNITRHMCFTIESGPCHAGAYARTIRPSPSTLMPPLIVHPRTAVRGSNVRDNRGPVRDNRVPPYAIIGGTPYAIIGSSQNYCRIHADMVTIRSQSGHMCPDMVTIRPPCAHIWAPPSPYLMFSLCFACFLHYVLHAFYRLLRSRTR